MDIFDIPHDIKRQICLMHKGDVLRLAPEEGSLAAPVEAQLRAVKRQCAALKRLYAAQRRRYVVLFTGDRINVYRDH